MNAPGESRKTIVINEGYIDPNGSLIYSSKRRKPANKTLKNVKISPQSKEISKQILQKIRERYKNISFDTHTPPTQQTSEETHVNEENLDLVQSIDFLEKLTQNVQSRPVQLDHTKPHELHRKYTPQYGCLKRGVLPTYRTLYNTTQKYHHPSHHTPPHSPISISYNTPVYSQQTVNTPVTQNPYINTPALLQTKSKSIEDPIEQEIKDLSIRSQFAELKQGVQDNIILGEETPQQNNLLQLEKSPENLNSKNYQKRTVRRTHRVGRSRRLPIVSVLLPNKTIRSKVSTHSKTLKTLPMQQVKNSLIKSGMIKIGSDAPENVLREIYENMCLIGGPVMNYNPDVLYYNMLHNS